MLILDVDETQFFKDDLSACLEVLRKRTMWNTVIIMPTTNDNHHHHKPTSLPASPIISCFQKALCVLLALTDKAYYYIVNEVCAIKSQK